MKIFTDFDYPKFPGKWPLKLTAVQLEKRRLMLENFIKESEFVVKKEESLTCFLAAQQDKPYRCGLCCC